MSRYVFKVPDLGEGTVSAEIVSWRVKPGDVVSEDQPLVEMSTDKAVVEVPSPVSGRVLSLAGEPGDNVAVGAELLAIETEADAAAAAPFVPATAALAAAPVAPPLVPSATAASARVKASPATRRRAREAGIDLRTVAGSGPGGRIEAGDLANARGAAGSVMSVAPESATEEIKIIGVRRLIAQRMADAKRNIPHFAYVEEVDVTELERLRLELNQRLQPGQVPLSYLPFIIVALVRVLPDFPQCIVRHRAVHVGIATQTPDGLKVPVLRHAQTRSLRDLAVQIQRLAQAARDNTVRREQLSGSTITVTSLGKFGGIASTPIINAPEVAIIGVNKAVERPVVRDGSIVIRRMMNLSSSFDHRFVDGFDAAAMVQAVKDKLEHPATLFVD
jgi:2-oxoisovalerate dehydrogenase E2 component (dihydrolipoyl transacylase)